MEKADRRPCRLPSPELHHSLAQDSAERVAAYGPVIDLDAELAELYAERRGDGTANLEDQPYPDRRCLSRGAICCARIRFTDDTFPKVRPGLVLALQGCNVVLAPLTTHPPRDEFDLEMLPSKENGLSKQGTVRCSQIGLISRRLVLRVLGRTDARDFQRVIDTLAHWFNHVVLAA